MPAPPHMFSRPGTYYHPQVTVDCGDTLHFDGDPPDWASKRTIHGEHLANCAFCGTTPTTLVQQRKVGMGYVEVRCNTHDCLSIAVDLPGSDLAACVREWAQEQRAIKQLLALECCGKPVAVLTSDGAYFIRCGVCSNSITGPLKAQKALILWHQEYKKKKKSQKKPAPKPRMSGCALCGSDYTYTSVVPASPLRREPTVYASCGACRLGEDGDERADIPHNYFPGVDARGHKLAADNWNRAMAILRLFPKNYRERVLDDQMLEYTFTEFDGWDAVVLRCATCGEVPQLGEVWPHCRCWKGSNNRGIFTPVNLDARRKTRAHNVEAWNQHEADAWQQKWKKGGDIVCAVAKKRTPGGDAIKFKFDPEHRIRTKIKIDGRTLKNTNPCGETRRDDMENIKKALQTTNVYAAGAMKAGAKQVVGMKVQKAIMAQVKTLLGDHFPAEFYATPLGRAVLDLGCCYTVNAVSNAFPTMPGADTVREYSANAMAGVTAENLTPLMEMAETMIGGIAAEATKLGLDKPKKSK